MNEKLIQLGIDPSSIKPNTTVSTKSNHGTVWVKHYALTIRMILFNVLIVGSYSGLELGEDGNRVLTLWEPVDELPEGSIDPLEIIQEIEKGVKEEDVRQKKEKLVINERVAREAQKFIEQLRSSGYVNAVNSPYLTRKKIETQKGTYIDQSGTLIIPMVAERGFVWNYQRITPEGDKYFLAGGRISGCYHVVSTGTTNTIFVGEGYVTCASVAMAFKEQNKRPIVICAFNSGNMPHVVKAMKALHPDKKIIVLADNDQWKERNTGILTAQKCGEAFITPQFNLEDEAVQALKPTDFNDLHTIMSLGEVYRQIHGGLELINNATKKREEAALSANISGEDETEISVARKLVTHFGDSIIACGEDLFVWDSGNGYWKHLEKGNFQSIMQIIIRFFGDSATDKKVKGAFNLFRVCISQVSQDIFTQKKHLCNFKNGTLVLNEGKVWLKPHDKRDLLTYSLPLLCPLNAANKLEGGDYSPPEGLFRGLLRQVSQDNPETLRLLAQMYGALLFPVHPQIFFILGKANSGKSTIAKVALNLVGIQNCSSVSPNRLFGFNLHQTMGKRVNYDLDIPTKFPLTDDVLKKVIDQVPIQIERKNRDAVQATLPPVHLYAGNDLPNLGEGNAKPFERRVSFIEVKSQEIREPIRNLHEQILEKELEHVLNFAIQGALSLSESGGAYLQTEAKKESLRDWELASSPEKDFWDQLKSDGVPVYDDDGKSTGDRLFYEVGKMAMRPLVYRTAKKVIGQQFRKHLLFKELFKNGVYEHASSGVVYFANLTVRLGNQEI